MTDIELVEFAERYTSAWCSQDAASVAAFFAQTGSLRINSNLPAVGQSAITEVVQSFMTAFPNLRVSMDKVVVRENHAEYHWTLTGVNAGPGGTGHQVRISGHEVWHIGENALIAHSQGHFDASEYQRQLEQGA